ncbi:hypothetical protein D3C72_1809150 [compost metagenome]
MLQKKVQCAAFKGFVVVCQVLLVWSLVASLWMPWLMRACSGTNKIRLGIKWSKPVLPRHVMLLASLLVRLIRITSTHPVWFLLMLVRKKFFLSLLLLNFFITRINICLRGRVLLIFKVAPLFLQVVIRNAQSLAVQIPIILVCIITILASLFMLNQKQPSL